MAPANALAPGGSDFGQGISGSEACGPKRRPTASKFGGESDSSRTETFRLSNDKPAPVPVYVTLNDVLQKRDRNHIP